MPKSKNLSAIVQLFGLAKILKYKKGNLAERQAELLNSTTISLQFSPDSLFSSPTIPSSSKEKELKTIEDWLDSPICAYVGAYWWYWRKERNWVLGDTSTGYIAVSAPQEKRKHGTMRDVS
ncbi:DUF429 domain-containing protein [Pleurocapsales cyanobacterium LEGE 06147]|nr:DUF429 domain-containing protein [Pleurocapsales cyanobacterium LEGE 06147]